MKRFLTIISSVFLFSALSCYAQNNGQQDDDTAVADTLVIDPLWLSMPETVCPSMKFSDVLPKESTSDFFSASISTVSSLQMRKLPSSSGDILCVVKTYTSPGADSDVEFYDMSWNRVGEQKFSIGDVIPESALTAKGLTMSRLTKLLQPLLISAALSADTTDLTLTINPVMLSEDELKELKDLPLATTLKWNGTSFK